MTAIDQLANALVAVGCPERCAYCGTNARSLAVLATEVYPLLDMEPDNPVVEFPRQPAVLAEAQRLVDGDRQVDYGDPVECMGKWATILNLLYGWDIDAYKASVAMSLLKHVREANRPKRDNRVDSPAYMHIADLAYERLFGVE